MSRKTTARSLLTVSATAMTAIGILAISAPVAQATPMFPSAPAPACVQYGWDGITALSHTNGWTATFSAEGSAFHAAANGSHPSGLRQHGVIEGAITGGQVKFAINWDTGAHVIYTGTVGEDKKAHGKAFDKNSPVNQADWHTVAPLKCLKTAEPAPAPAPVPPPVKDIGRKDVIVVQASDVYDAPGGTGNKILVNGGDFFLQPDRKLQWVEPCKDNWCHLKIHEVPGGTGWVFAGDEETDVMLRMLG